MYKKGANSKDSAIFANYGKIANLIRMPTYFYQTLIEKAGLLRNRTVLDIGCGNGFLLDEVYKKEPTNKLFGIEPSKLLFKNAKKLLGKKARIINCEGEKLPFPDKQFDVVFICEVLEHVKEPCELLLEAKRVTKDGGELIVSFPNIDAFFPFYLFIDKLPFGFKLAFLPDEHPEKSIQPIDCIFTISKAKKIFQKAGLKEHLFGVQFFPWLFSISSLRNFYKSKRSFLDKLFNKARLLFFAYRIIAVLRKNEAQETTG